MATIERELEELKARVDRLEATVRSLANEDDQPSRPFSAEPLDRAQLLAWLEAEGLIRAPTAEELRLGAEWRALPDEEKQAILWELDHLPPGPMLSDIIIENRD